jgi:hypothetical protein
MRPDARFIGQPKNFWACIRTISQWVGYTERGKGAIKVPAVHEIQEAFKELNLNAQEIIDESGLPTTLANNLHGYFEHRAKVLDGFVKPRLMNLQKAKAVFERIRDGRPHACPMPQNKQKGEKKAVAYLTAITNMLIEENLGELPCNFDPRILTTVTKGGVPLRTLSRRVDGAFPGAINPISIWEIKEYYYTTTFGSRVADGVYETLLDGMELEELCQSEKVKVQHYLILDDYFTWWECGRSYLCRIIDLLHMGYVDEVLFGSEVIEEMPRIVREWVRLHEAV